jgi:hypothetical protein
MSNFILLWLIWQILKHDAKNETTLDIRFQSSILLIFFLICQISTSFVLI